jgi:hypothetical protein
MPNSSKVAVVGGVAAVTRFGNKMPPDLVMATLIVAPGVVAIRQLRRAMTRHAVDRALAEAVRQALGPMPTWPALRRVK